MNLNPFNKESSLFDFRWFIVITLCLAVFMTWHDLRGGRMFSSNKAKEWNKSGPGYHK